MCGFLNFEKMKYFCKILFFSATLCVRMTTKQKIEERSTMNDNFHIDNEIIEKLFNRDEKGLDLLTDHYHRFCESIIREVLDNDADVQECFNDLLLGIWNSIPPNRPLYLSAYIAKFARRIGISRFRYNTRKKRDLGYAVSLSELEEVLPSRAAENEMECAQLSALISDFLRTLDKKSRVLFIRRYVYFESVTSLSQRFGISENNLSVKLYRIRNKLKTVLEKGGIYI